jgi:AcrR family transcriptional regulator
MNAEQGNGSESATRLRQRRRTRGAIVAAAAELLRAGTTPSVGQVAEAADVSRRTVYQYFPTLEQLLIDATLGLLDQSAVDRAIEAAEPADDAAARFTALVEALAESSADQLPLGRQLIRLTVETPAADDPDAPRRGYRRIGWIETALEPVRGTLSPERFEQLVSSLAMVIGWEALVVLSDVRGLQPAEQLDVQLWTSRALIRAALEESG